MANFASIRFYVPSSGNSPLDYSRNFACTFDGVDITGVSAAVNDFSNVQRKFATTPSVGIWQNWASPLKSLLEVLYIGVQGKKFTVFLASNYIELTATEFGHVFATKAVDFQIEHFSPIVGTVTAEVATETIAVTSIVPAQGTTIQGSRNTRCNYQIGVSGATYPTHIKSLPSGANDLGFTLGVFATFEYERTHARPQLIVVDSQPVESPAFTLPIVQSWFVDSVITTGDSATIVAKTAYADFDKATTLSYSINGSLYQNSNNFPSLPVGNYTAYILDSLGGIWTKDFVIANLENKSPAFIDFSDVNSMQYRDDAQNRNRLSLFARQKFINQEKPCFYQLFDARHSSPITTQFRSSYDSAIAIVEGEALPLTITEVVTNLNKEDWRDCQFADGGLNKTLIFFESGNVYDPATGFVIRTYNNITVAGLTLESWQEKGIIVELTIGSFIVSDVVFNSTVGGMCLVIDIAFNSFVPEICKSRYNKEDWNVFKFDVDMGLLSQHELHRVGVLFQDSVYPTVTWYSEPFKVVEDDDLLKLECSGNATISDMIPTGIVHTLFLEAVLIDSEPFQDVETSNSDIYNSIKVKSNYDAGYTLATTAIAPYLIQKINLLLLFDTILIDGLPFEIDKEAKIEFWNDKNNPLGVLRRSFRPNKTSSSNNITVATSRVLGASNVTVLGA